MHVSTVYGGRAAQQDCIVYETDTMFSLNYDCYTRLLVLVHTPLRYCHFSLNLVQAYLI